MAKEEATLIIKMKDMASKPIKGLRKAFSNVVITAGDVVSALKSIGSAAFELAKTAGQYESVQKAFRSMAENQGQDADQMLVKMRELSAGTVSDLKLMQQANTALLLGLPVDRFGDMLTIARSASQATGESMEFMLNSIVTGLGRGSKLMLDNLGIVFKLEDAYAEYAASLGKTATQLTEAEKKQAFINKALETGKKNAEAAGGVQLTLAERMGQVTAKAENTAVILGRALGPAFEFAIDKVMDFSDTLVDIAKSNIFVDFIKFTINSVNGLGIAIAAMAAKTVSGFATIGETVVAATTLQWGKIPGIVKNGLAQIDEVNKAADEQWLADKQKLNERFAQNEDQNRAQDIEKLRAHLEKKRQAEAEGAATALEEKVARDQEAFMAETEMLTANEDQKLQLKINALNKALASETNHANKMKLLKDKQALLDKDRENKLQAFKDAKRKAEIAAQSNTLGVIQGLSSSNSAALNSIAKAAGVTRIAINTPIAISEALKAFPPPFNFAAATAVGAAMAVQAGKIAGIPLAEGGIVPSTPGGIQATIGEGGRSEAVIPLPDDFDPDAGGVGGGNTFIFNGPVLGDEEQARQFAIVIDRELLTLRQNNESISFDEDVI